MNPPAFNLEDAHRYFSAACFNRTWELIEKPNRNAADDEQMLLGCLASLWHWTQRPDCSPRTLSIGHWQVSRVCALLGQGENARRHGQAALDFAANEPPFYRGYGHEALARAAALLKDRAAHNTSLQHARECCAQCADAGERAMLAHDLDELARLVL